MIMIMIYIYIHQICMYIPYDYILALTVNSLGIHRAQDPRFCFELLQVVGGLFDRTQIDRFE